MHQSQDMEMEGGDLDSYNDHSLFKVNRLNPWDSQSKAYQISKKRIVEMLDISTILRQTTDSSNFIESLLTSEQRKHLYRNQKNSICFMDEDPHAKRYDLVLSARKESLKPRSMKRKSQSKSSDKENNNVQSFIGQCFN